MKTIVWKAKSQIALENKAVPDVGPGEMLVNIMASTICGSDIKIWHAGNPRVSPGTTLGHEAAGVVVAVGSGVDKFRVGDRIAIGADVPCDECDFCLSGFSTSCTTNLAIGHQFEGTFAEYILLNERTTRTGPVVKLKDTTPFELAALAEPLGCCINGFERALGGETVRPQALLAVIGAGPIGLMLASLGKHYGFERTIIFDISRERLDRAKNMGIGDILVNTDGQELSELMSSVSGGADLVFSANASASSQNLAIQLCRPRGVVNFFGGLPQGNDLAAMPTNLVHYRELKVVGSHGSTPEQHRTAVKLIEDGEVDISQFITKRFALEDFAIAFETAQAGNGLKILFDSKLKGQLHV